MALALTTGLLAAAFELSTRRDVGAGLRQSRPGAATASKFLVHPIGFALRLHRKMMLGFAAGLFVLSAAYGSILGEVEDMLSGIEVFQDAVERIGGATITESFAAMTMVILAIVASVYVVLAGLRPRAEENTGRAEPVLATPLSRVAWLGSHLAAALIGSVLMLLAAGLGFGISGAASTSDSGVVGTLLGAALAYLPALWLTAGVTVLLVGFAPRATQLAWIGPLYGFLVGYLGQILQFPGWLDNLSPFSHIPRLPAKELTITPLLILTGLAAVLVAAGLAAFRRRDIIMT